MITKKERIELFSRLPNILNTSNAALHQAIDQTYQLNSWLTPENYWHCIEHWNSTLTSDKLIDFLDNYDVSSSPKNVGIIMAGNIPMVGFHDLLCVCLIGHNAFVKLSSDDNRVIPFIIHELISMDDRIAQQIVIKDKIQSIDAVIATGSNNSFRYFENYFQHIPRLLRKNRKSMAILDGSETQKDLAELSKDILMYYGLGCRNVSLIFLPKQTNINKLLDEMSSFKDIINHNKYANNYTYHKALLLMNNEQHLDTGFLLPKNRRDLFAPLACINYAYYESIDELDTFVFKNKDDIQCIVGNYSSTNTISFGKAQTPDLKQFADDINTLEFLSTL